MSYAVQFDAANTQYLQTGSIADLSGAFTVEFMLELVNTTDSNTPILGNGAYYTHYNGVTQQGNKLSATISDGVSNMATITSSYALSTSNWYRISLVSNGANATAYLYINGVNEGSVAVGSFTPYLFSTGQGWGIRVAEGPGGAGGNSNCIVEDIRVFSVAVPQSTISSWMYKRVDSTHPYYSLLAVYLKMNEGGGTTLTDSSGHGITGTLYSSPTWVTGYSLDFQQYTRSQSDGITFSAAAISRAARTASGLITFGDISKRTAARVTSAPITFSEQRQKGVGLQKTDSILISSGSLGTAQRIRSQSDGITFGAAAISRAARTASGLIAFADTSKRTAARVTSAPITFSEQRQKGVGLQKTDSMLISGAQSRRVASTREELLNIEVSQSKGLALGIGDSLGVSAAPIGGARKSVADSEALMEARAAESDVTALDSMSWSEWLEYVNGRAISDALSFLTDEQLDVARSVLSEFLEIDIPRTEATFSKVDGMTMGEVRYKWLSEAIEDVITESHPHGIYLKRREVSVLLFADTATYTRIVPLLAFIPKVSKVLGSFRVTGDELFGRALRKDGFKLVGEKFKGLFKQKSAGD